jgi:hypothetical protein
MARRDNTDRLTDPLSPVKSAANKAHAALDRYGKAAVYSPSGWTPVSRAGSTGSAKPSLLRVPGLAALGVRPEHASDIVAKAPAASSIKFNPVALTQDELHSILENRYEPS